MYPHAHIRSLNRSSSEATALRPVPACAGRQGAAALSPSGTPASLRRLGGGIMKAPLKSIFPAVLVAVALSGCYVVPVSPEGYPYPSYPYPGYPGAAPLPPVATPAPPAAQVLSVRLYPANEKAAQSGVLNGTVTSTSFGKGRFQLNYRGETLNGEATRVDGDSRRGVASAYGSSGAFMSCEYQMQSARQGAGTCTLSDGAKYQVHIGI